MMSSVLTDLASGMKRCSKCGQVKPPNAFSLQTGYTDRYRSQCKVCRSHKQMERYRDDPAGMKARRQAAYWRDPEETREKRREYRARVPERVRQWRQDEYRRDSAKIRQRVDRWNAANPGRSLERALRWQLANPDKAWARNQKRRARLRNAPVVEQIDRQAIIKRDGGICQICHRPVPTKQIHLDHIVPLSQGGDHTAANLRLTHQLCNLRRKRKAYAEQLRISL